MTIGFYSPLPPARTGVAHYSATLLDALRPLSDVKIDAEGKVCLYHLGNNGLHREIYERALTVPGVVVLHDAVLHHFLLGTLDRDSYVEEFTFNYGEWSRSLAGSLWSERARSAADPRFFKYAMLRRIAERSLAVIVHNPRAASFVREHAPSAPVYEIPHLFPAQPAVPGWRIERLRQAWKIAPSTFVFGVFGYLRESKRLAPCLRAFEAVRKEMDCALLVCGQFASEDLEREMEPRLRAPGIVRAGYVPEESLREIASAVDACLNLRYPGAGETSGIAIRLMGAGKPVFLTAGEETSDFPVGACLRIDAGPAELEMLTRYMQWMASDRQAARDIGRRAASHIAARHAPERAARMYLDVLNTSSH